VIDDDAANRHWFTLSNAGPGVATVGKLRAYWMAARAGVAREHRVGGHLAVMASVRECPPALVPGNSVAFPGTTRRPLRRTRETCADLLRFAHHSTDSPVILT
jgi:hypothetical protein